MTSTQGTQVIPPAVFMPGESKTHSDAEHIPASLARSGDFFLEDGGVLVDTGLWTP